MPGFTITRGLGGSASSLVVRGFVETVRSIIKGGRRFAERAVADLEEKLKISIMLISANGKELRKPIFNNVSKILRSTSDIAISVTPKTLVQRKSKRIKVTASLRDEKYEQD